MMPYIFDLSQSAYGMVWSVTPGADGGTRTRTGLPPRDFKSLASTHSATSACSVLAWPQEAEREKPARPSLLHGMPPGAVPVVACYVGHRPVGLVVLVGY